MFLMTRFRSTHTTTLANIRAALKGHLISCGERTLGSTGALRKAIPFRTVSERKKTKKIIIISGVLSLESDIRLFYGENSFYYIMC